jgi:hypothetical protein
MGVTIGWALNPDSVLRKSAEEVWDLFFPSLFADTTKKSKERRRVRS